MEKAENVQWVFMLYDKPFLSQGLCETEHLTLGFPGTLAYEAEAIPVTDERMAQNFPGTIWRVVLTATAAKEHLSTFLMEVKS